MRISDWSSDVCSSDLIAKTIAYERQVAAGEVVQILYDQYLRFVHCFGEMRHCLPRTVGIPMPSDAARRCTGEIPGHIGGIAIEPENRLSAAGEQMVPAIDRPPLPNARRLADSRVGHGVGVR